MLKQQVFNFCAGPCVLPHDVFKQFRDEMLSYKGTGLSVMELSHRSKAFTDITTQLLEDLREFLEVPKTHKILLFQGGASLQYAAIIKNLLKPSKGASYLTTGHWSN